MRGRYSRGRRDGDLAATGTARRTGDNACRPGQHPPSSRLLLTLVARPWPEAVSGGSCVLRKTAGGRGCHDVRPRPGPVSAGSCALRQAGGGGRGCHNVRPRPGPVSAGSCALPQAGGGSRRQQRAWAQRPQLPSSTSWLQPAALDLGVM